MSKYTGIGLTFYIDDKAPGVDGVEVDGDGDEDLKQKFMSCRHCQELDQLADLASDWLFTLVQPIRSQHAY